MISLPAVIPERWRAVESFLRQFDVDIQRLWRLVADLQATSNPGQSDALTPDDLEDISGCTPSFEIRHWYHPSGGSSEVNVTFNAVTEPITLNSDDDAAAVKTQIDAHSEMVAAGKTCATTGTDLENGSVFVAMPEGGLIEPGDYSGLTANTSTGYTARQTVVACRGCS